MTEPLTYMVRLLINESGATAIEYGLMAGLIALVIVGTVILIGSGIETVFTIIGTCVAGMNPASCP